MFGKYPSRSGPALSCAGPHPHSSAADGNKAEKRRRDSVMARIYHADDLHHTRKIFTTITSTAPPPAATLPPRMLALAPLALLVLAPAEPEPFMPPRRDPVINLPATVGDGPIKFTPGK